MKPRITAKTPASKRLGLNQADFWRPIGVTQTGGSRYESSSETGRTIPKQVLALLRIRYGTPKERETVVAELSASDEPALRAA